MNAMLTKCQPIIVNGWWKRVGLAGFWFFLIKGSLWLIAPLAFYVISQ